MSKSRSGSPRKFSEKIALLNKKEAEGNAEFEKIIKEVEETTRAPVWYPSRSSSSSSWLETRQYIDESQQPQSLEFIPIHNGYTIQQQQQQQQHHSPQHHHRHNQPPQQTHITTQHQHQSLSPAPPQQQQVVLIEPAQPNQVTVDTPIGVPNIAIFPIEDDGYQQQVIQQQQVTPVSSYLNARSNSICSSRSLPDIANLRVSGSCTDITGSYSQQSLSPEDYNDYSYDTNSNIVDSSITDIQGQDYCDPLNDQSQPPHQQHHLHSDQPIPLQHQNQPSHGQADTNWQQFNSLNSHNRNNNSHIQPLHQNYYQDYQQGPIMRANSSNTVSTNNYSLSAPRVSNHLSKSSEIYYGNYVNEY